MLTRKWIANGHGPAMLVAFFLSLLAGAPAAAVAQLPSGASALEQAGSSQAIFIKRAHALQALRAPQPTPFAAIIPGEFRLSNPLVVLASVDQAGAPTPAPARAPRKPYQPRAPPAA